jgi:hypothetical protein
MPRPKKQEADATSTNGAAEAAPANAAAEAFAKVEPELAALPPEAIVPLAIDPAAAIAAVLAAAPRIREHRDAIVEQLPKHPLRQLDELETYAQAAWYAHLVQSYASTSPEAAKALVDEATRLREGLLIAAEALAHRALLDADAIARVRKSGGHDLAGDLIALAAVFKASWSKVSSKTAVERGEVERAAELGPAVLVASTVKKHKNVDTEAQRARAIALLVDAYDTCRRAIGYLRWKEGDVDTIAPPFPKKRAPRKPKQDEEATAAAEPDGAAEA